VDATTLRGSFGCAVPASASTPRDHTGGRPVGSHRQPQASAEVQQLRDGIAASATSHGPAAPCLQRPASAPVKKKTTPIAATWCQSRQSATIGEILRSGQGRDGTADTRIISQSRNRENTGKNGAQRVRGSKTAVRNRKSRSTYKRSSTHGRRCPRQSRRASWQWSRPHVTDTGVGRSCPLTATPGCNSDNLSVVSLTARQQLARPS
jgi:hypothetical protein